LQPRTICTATHAHANNKPVCLLADPGRAFLHSHPAKRSGEPTHGTSNARKNTQPHKPTHCTNNARTLTRAQRSNQIMLDRNRVGCTREGDRNCTQTKAGQNEQKASLLRDMLDILDLLRWNRQNLSSRPAFTHSFIQSLTQASLNPHDFDPCAKEETKNKHID